MFRLIRGIVLLLLLAALAVAAFTVPLGSKTFWEHLRAIAGTEESQELVDGVKAKASEVLHDRQAESRPSSGGPEAEPQDSATPAEQQRLRKLIRGKLDRRSKREPSPD